MNILGFARFGRWCAWAMRIVIYRAFQKELYTGIADLTVWWVLRKIHRSRCWKIG
jgi:hypothetical protein